VERFLNIDVNDKGLFSFADEATGKWRRVFEPQN
jgi:hypothetical protein